MRAKGNGLLGWPAHVRLPFKPVDFHKCSHEIRLRMLQMSREFGHHKLRLQIAASELNLLIGHGDGRAQINDRVHDRIPGATQGRHSYLLDGEKHKRELITQWQDACQEDFAPTTYFRDLSSRCLIM